MNSGTSARIVHFQIAGLDYDGEYYIRDYLFRLRWPGGFVCPDCGEARKPWRTGRGRVICASCRHQTSVTTGTLLDNTHLPLKDWFLAAWLSTTQPFGISALALQSVLGLGSYRSAWAMLHRLRLAMADAPEAKLSGIVQVDRANVGGSRVNANGRQAGTRLTVGIAVETASTTSACARGKTRLARLPDFTEAAFLSFVQSVVAPGAVVVMGNGLDSVQLAVAGYRCIPLNRLTSSHLDPTGLTAVHRIAALLKRWLNGTLHGSFPSEYADSYLTEFAFRLNLRPAEPRSLLFFRLLSQAVRAASPHRSGIPRCRDSTARDRRRRHKAGDRDGGGPTSAETRVTVSRRLR